MSTIFDEYNNDSENNFSPITKPEKQKNPWPGRIIAFILGLILAACACLGGAFIFLRQPLSDILTTINFLYGINEEGNKLLRPVGDCTLQELSSAINELTVGELFTSDIFLADKESDSTPYHGYYLNNGENFEDSNGEIIYQMDFYVKVLKKDGSNAYDYYHFDPLTTFDSEEHELAIEEKYGIELNVELNKQWKYLLNDKNRPDKSKPQYRFDYLISNGMNRLTENLAANVHYATLGDLYKDELLQLDNDGILQQEVQTSIIVGTKTCDLGLSFADTLPENPKVSDLTMEQMMEYNMAIMNALSNANAAN